MKRVLFLIHDLGPGGAEKVLVNLVNGMDRDAFDISVRTLFDFGPNRRFLKDDVHYSSWMPGNVPANSHWMKLWTPEQLWRMIIPDGFDLVVSFLEGPSARVVGGCPAGGPKTAVWIHITIPTAEKFAEGFRNRAEAERCYRRADGLAFVSEDVRDAFLQHMDPEKRTEVLYNVYESDRIRSLALEEPAKPAIDAAALNWCSVGKLIPRKGWDRMLRIQKQLVGEGIPARFYILGDGPLRKDLEKLAADLGVADSVTFTGYQLNPYAYVSRCMLSVCASQAEGFSTAAVESLLVGTPFCSVEVGGMYELLGRSGEYGIVVKNNDEDLYRAVKKFFTDSGFRADYRQRALTRGNDFEKESAIRKAEAFLLSL